MIIELTELNGKSIFINKYRIQKFYYLPEGLGGWDKTPFTEIDLLTCALKVKEKPESIALLCNKK